MQVYVLAAEADSDAATDLEQFLKRHGCLVRIALGHAMFHPARPGEMTIALWSMNTRMSAHQITFTNRSIDALVDERLVVGQLDFHPLPYGLTDVTPYDLRSPGMRNMRYQQMLAELRKLERKKLFAAPPPSAEIIEEASGADADETDISVREHRQELSEISTDAFVSYAYLNKDIVWPIVDAVKDSDLDIWIDKQEIKPGANWAGDIVRAIKSTKMFCIMCSAQSYASDHVRREVYLADRYDKPILPVLLENTLMPEDIEYFLIDRQCLDLTQIDGGKHADALLAAINA